MSESEQIQIRLNPRLTPEDRELAARYVTPLRSITSQEWPRALTAFDLLGASTLIIEGREQKFAAFYTEHVEDKYAAAFVDEIMRAVDAQTVGTQCIRDIGRQVEQDLATLGVHRTGGIEQQCLIAFCIYWWASFSKGYLREVVIFRDLQDAGIEFVAHDLRSRQERFSPHDLTVLGFRGDVKSSTYFLHTARSYPLMNDFYIARIYDTVQRQWCNIVLVKPVMWAVIDGETTPRKVDDVPRMLPQPTQIETREEALVVITYDDWKQRVLQVQTKQKEGQSHE